MTASPAGRRERKKAATRQAIADAALELFLERGYDQVSISDIADAADVSKTTVFKHFTGKEALVFDRDPDQETELIAAVRRRPAGQSVVDALREHVLDTLPPIETHPQRAAFVRLVDSTPELRSYSERMWTRHTGSLAAAIADEFGVDHDDLACATLARYVLDIPALVRGRRDLPAAIRTCFDVLTRGWRPPSTPTTATAV
ncbi:TetR family transcriptional regulator [Nonomuraea sp. SMC257]|uniref:TetR family transcriptional regulator n=1 Tax=Nonomuraea montanisoli TaxID=2741721 RepID=A0A7Y6M6L4_9ACTN|nr:TetR/AcrR family transcriptional regulator [Nonomuraea montanisoli]NUW35731.1 TetR family transcriptional regulator [Nonomuraea montanisoli]